MSEEPQGMSVEDDGTAPAAPVAAPEPPPAAAAPPQPAADEPVDVGGQKMVPLAALQAERDQARALKDKAAKYDEVERWYNSSRPAIDFLQQNPHLMQPRQQQTTTQPEPQQTADPRWARLAQKLDLYTPDGKPDVERAREVMQDMSAIAEERAQAAVKPIQETTTRERAQMAYQRALQIKAPNGMTPDPAILGDIYRHAAAAGNLEYLATDQGASAAAALAVGLQAMNQPVPQPQVELQAPIVSEPVGSRNINRPAASEMETRVARIRGIDPQKWSDLTAKFKVGEANTLED